MTKGSYISINFLKSTQSINEIIFYCNLDLLGKKGKLKKILIV